MRSTCAIVNLNNLRHNLIQIRQQIGSSRLIAVVKANAYGHGLVNIGRELENLGVDFFAVAFLSEGIELRDNGIRSRVLVLVPEGSESVDEFIHNDLDVMVDSFLLAKEISRQARNRQKIARLHLYVDTGMGRDGVHFSKVRSLMEKIVDLPNIEVVGLASHFATSADDIDFARLQLKRFSQTLNELMDAGYRFDLIHIANSSAVLNLPASLFNAVRVGLLLYGYVPNSDISQRSRFRPILELRSRVTSERIITAGESVGYGREYIAKETTRVVTIPIGYGDGLARRLAPGFCLINGKRFPIVGGICMDEIMVDVGLSSEVQIGDEVVLLGSQNGESITGYELADRCKTIVYEITTSISTRIPRFYY